MESAPEKETQSLEKLLEEHQHRLRRTDALLYFIAVVVAAGAIFLPGLGERANLPVAIPVILVSLGGAVVVYLFPWHKFHPDLFVVVGVVGVVQISMLIWATGGPRSPFFPYFFFLVVAAGAYHRRLWPLILLISLSILGSASFLLYTRPLPPDFLHFLIVIALIFVTGATVTVFIFRSLEKTSDQLEKRVRELTALNRLFQQYLNQGQGKTNQEVQSSLTRLQEDLQKLCRLLATPGSTA